MTYPPFPAPRRSEPRRRWPWILAAATAAVLVAAGGVIASNSNRVPVPTYPTTATSVPTSP